MEKEHRLALAYQPYIQKDLNEPFPIRYFGYTVFRDREPSPSFPKLTLDPSELGAAYIIEYAVYYDYDIQHLYDLEHVWVAVDQAGTVPSRPKISWRSAICRWTSKWTTTCSTPCGAWISL